MKIAPLFLLLAFLVCPAWAGYGGGAVEVRIVTDEGRTLPIYPVTTGHQVRKVYAEAVKGDHYRIEVRNLLNRRIGVVIAVDGRNIISGGKIVAEKHRTDVHSGALRLGFLCRVANGSEPDQPFLFYRGSRLLCLGLRR